MWLRDYLPHNFKNCRCLTWGYDARLENGQSRGILFDHTNNFATQLQDMRYQSKSFKRPIIFIGHSLGCLIIKDALIKLNSSKRKNGSEPPPIACLVFFGSPHRGLEVESLRTLVNGMPSEDLVWELKRDSPTLTRLNTEFKELYGGFDILTIYELRDTPSARQKEDGSWDTNGPLITMVPRDSAVLHWEKEKILGVSQHHREMARVGRGQGGCYSAIRSFVQRSLEQVIAQEPSELVARGPSGLVAQGFSELAAQGSSERVIPQWGQDVTKERGMSSSLAQSTSVITEFLDAIRGGTEKEVQGFLERGIDVDCCDREGQTPLHIAARYASAEVVLLLLNHGANVEMADKKGWTPLHKASQFNSAEIVKTILAAGADPFRSTTNKQCSPLHLAAEAGKSVETIDLMIATGIGINIRDSGGYSALHYAARSIGNECMVRHLLKRGANVNARGDPGEAPLHTAARVGATTDLDCNLQGGADLNDEDHQGWTPLHYAASSGQVSSVTTLLARGANASAQDHNGLRASDVECTGNVPAWTGPLIRRTLKQAEHHYVP